MYDCSLILVCSQRSLETLASDLMSSFASLITLQLLTNKSFAAGIGLVLTCAVFCVVRRTTIVLLSERLYHSVLSNFLVTSYTETVLVSFARLRILFFVNLSAAGRLFEGEKSVFATTALEELLMLSLSAMLLLSHWFLWAFLDTVQQYCLYCAVM